MEETSKETMMEELRGGVVLASGETKNEPGEVENNQGKGQDSPCTGVDRVVDPVSFSNLEVSLERLLERQRSEIMFDLRRLQYGERPVTGQEQRRRAVEGLVLRAVGPAAARPPGPDSAANRPPGVAVDVSRPEHIVVEVNALVERRPVSSILHSLQFRRRLEDSVRGALQTMRGGGLGGQGSTQRDHPPSVPTSGHSTTEAVEEVQRSASYVGRSPSSLSIRSESPQSSVAMEETGPPGVVPSPPVLPPATDYAPENSTGTARAAEWIQQHVTHPTDPVAGRQQRASSNILDRMHHEEFIVEISDLIHRQLVTSTLNGSFREVLERRMRSHMENSGIEGARVQEQLRQLPRSTVHLRNDFIDLGIIHGAVGEAGDAMDDVSVISATAAVAFPQAYTQNNLAMNREIHSLRTELQEMKNMMRLSFDLQLDIQRSIRQEVAAALALKTTVGSSSSDPLPSTSSTSGRLATPASSSENCLICDDHQVDTVLYQCGHLCLCHACAMHLRQNGSNCPVCRAPIRDIMKTYRS